MKLFIKALVILLACCCIGVNAASNDPREGPQACLPLGKPCGIGVNGFRGAKCCTGFYCVSEVCKVFTNTTAGNSLAGNGKQPPPHPNVGVGNPNSKEPFDSPQEQQCKQKLKNAGCNRNAITTLGPYCVCGCPDVVTTSDQFATSCTPTKEDRIKLIRNCREYKNIRDCPQFKKQLTASPKCLALKDQFTEQCKACGSKCTLLVEKISGN